MPHIHPLPFHGILARASGILIFLLILALGAGPARGEELTLTDSLGRSIRLKLPIRRIVALNSDALEALRILKAEDLLVGVYSQIDRNPEFWKNLLDLPRVGHWKEPDIEAMAQLEPDLVLAYTRNPSLDLERMITAQGFPVLRLDFYRIETLEREILTLGRILGRDREAREFQQWHHRLYESFRTRLSRLKNRPLVYVESYSDFQAAGPDTGVGEMCTLAGGINIAGDMAIPFPRVTPEWVLSQNPDVIVKASSSSNGYGLSQALTLDRRREAIMKRPAWDHVPAVAAGRVFVMDNSIWTGPAAIVGVAYLATWFHPEPALKVNPQALHREYLEKFLGMPFKGVYISSLPKAQAP